MAVLYDCSGRPNQPKELCGLCPAWPDTASATRCAPEAVAGSSGHRRTTLAGFAGRRTPAHPEVLHPGNSARGLVVEQDRNHAIYRDYCPERARLGRRPRRAHQQLEHGRHHLLRKTERIAQSSILRTSWACASPRTRAALRPRPWSGTRATALRNGALLPRR